MDAAELLKRVRRVEITTRKLSDRIFPASTAVRSRVAAWRSENREYQPGDEVRTIDWNVTARTGSRTSRCLRKSASSPCSSSSTSARHCERHPRPHLERFGHRTVCRFGLQCNGQQRQGGRHLLHRPVENSSRRERSQPCARIVRDLLDFEPEACKAMWCRH